MIFPNRKKIEIFFLPLTFVEKDVDIFYEERDDAQAAAKSLPILLYLAILINTCEISFLAAHFQLGALAMSDNDKTLGTQEEQITDEDLDDFLAEGAKMLHGLEIIPEGCKDDPWPKRNNVKVSDFDRGNVLPTVYLDVPAGADRQERLGEFLFHYMQKRAT
jgi:hypothetical protein